MPRPHDGSADAPDGRATPDPSDAGADGPGVPMSEAPATGVDVAAPLGRVWDVVADPRTYPLWLVGAQRIRGVDAGWPAPGSSFHHTVGWLALRVRDRTEIVEVAPPNRLVLRAHMSVLGSATVAIDLTTRGRGTHVTMLERPHDGAIRALWRFGGRQVLTLGLWGRNSRSLDRLQTGIEDGAIIGRPDADAA